MSELKLEVGKSYRMRNGGKAEIIDYVSSASNLYNEGYVFKCVNDGSYCFSCTKEGRFYNNELLDNRLDLISEWEEEPKIHFEQPTPDFPKGGISANESILQEAERIINGDRREAYGDVKESFENVAKGWAVIFGNEVSGRQVGLAMSWLKICRENNNHKRDNLVDLAGYAALIDKL